MHGLMMDAQLLVTNILRFADANFPETEVISLAHDSPAGGHRTNYREVFARSRRLANALARLGVGQGDRVATLAWNDHRHLELYYAVSCMGAVCHTINPRLFSQQIEYIIAHAGDRIVFTDPMFVPLLEELADGLQQVQQIVVLTDEAHMPSSSLDLLCYETLLASESDTYNWPELDEQAAAAMCYTSGTTGNPKGVVYSHRATVLHAYGAALPDVMGLSATDCVMPLVPMFHVNAWGVPYAAPMTGAKLVLTGPKMAHGETLFNLIETEGVNYSLGVPTVWLGLLEWLESSGKRLTRLEKICVGGAACPQSVIERMERDHGVVVNHGWGMTEVSPLGVYNTLKPAQAALPDDERMAIRLKQGRGIFGVEMKIVDADDNELPWDGKAFGALKLKGPWVCSAYYGEEPGSALDADGWFPTGDVATIDADGYMMITDRTKDVIKSGGEWISSIELENIAVNHPGVAEAAVIGVAHPKWGERPLLIVVRADVPDTPDAQQLLGLYSGKVADWWVPDAVEFVAELPHTATGKLLKTALREQFAGYRITDDQTVDDSA